MRTTPTHRSQTDRLLSLLVGALAGLLFGCCVSAALLGLSSSSPSPAPASAVPPAAYDIEVIVEEDYINRTLTENSANVASSVPLAAGHLDLRPGGLADFVVQIEAGSLRPTFDGTVQFQATAEERLEVRFARVRAGYLPVTAFVPASQAVAVNESINRMLAERAGPLNLRVAGVASDDTTLRLYLTVVP